MKALTDGNKAQARETRIVLREVWEAIRCQLLDDELVVRFIRVKRINDVVAVRPRSVKRLNGAIPLQALRIRVARRIKPVTGPALTIVRRAQQLIDLPLDHGGRCPGRLTISRCQGIARQRRIILTGEGIHFCIGRRQAREIIGKAAQEGFAIRGRTGLEPLCVELGEHEGVDFILNPGGVA